MPVALITGAAQGVGYTTAKTFAAMGYHVVLTDVQPLEAQIDALSALGGSVSALSGDISSEAFVTELAEKVARDHTAVDVLVNNAGIYVPKLMMETDATLFERHTRINQLGCFLGMKAVVPAMERAGGGSIVNISSTAGLRGSARAFAYGATKWALRGMTKSAAMELAPRGIRVNSVHPGPVATPMLDIRTPEENAARLKSVPMGRQGTAEEVARLVLFLLADDSSYMTGSELAIDGGATL